MSIDYQQIQDVQSPFFEGAMAIYQEAFPSNERQPLSKIIERVDSRKSQLYVGILNNEVIAMALLWDFNNSPFVLLDYLAVKNNCRGKEIGAQFFQFLVQKTTKNKQFLILEVEHYLYGKNREERQRRINFYLKNGAYLMQNVPYILPSLDGTLPTEMLLMIAPKQAQSSIEKETIKNLMCRLYLEIYDKEANDPVLLSLLEKVPEQIELTNTQLL